MFDDPLTVAAAAGFAGFVAGFVLRSFIASRNAPNKGRSFSSKQTTRWNINEDWGNILLRKNKMQFAEDQLEILSESKDREVNKRKELYRERDQALEQLNDIRRQVKSAPSDFEGKAILQGIGTISADLSSIRRRFDRISGVFVTHHKKVSFLEAVLRNESHNQVVKIMDNSELGEAIKNNEGLSIDMTEAEIEAMGSAKSIEALKSILKI